MSFPDLSYQEMLALQAIELGRADQLDAAVVEQLVLKGLVSLAPAVQLTDEGKRWLTAYRKLGESPD